MKQLVETVKPNLIFTSSDKTIKEFQKNNQLKVISERVIPQITLNTSTIDQIENIQVKKMSESLASFQINSGMVEAVKRLNDGISAILSNSIREIVNNLSSAIGTAIKSPMVEWLQSFDFSPIRNILEGLNFDNDLVNRYKEFKDVYLIAMYECKWFPYAGWIADFSLFSEVSEIISTSRGASKRREKRIDKVILSYYTKNEIKNIKRSWKQSDLESHIKKILGQAIEAHLRGEYALTITCLATMWEGLIHKRTNVTGRRNSNKTKEDFKELIGENDFKSIFFDYYENMIVSQCNTPDEVIDGVPNRNGVSHSKYKKYPNKKASLNAILLTDFIISLEPKKKVEEQESGEIKNAFNQ